MPLLRWAHGRHRDLPPDRSSPRTTVIAFLSRQAGIMTRRSEAQATVEAIPLRPSGAHAPAAITSSATVPLLARSARPPPSDRVNHPLAARPLCPAPPASPSTPPSPRPSQFNRNRQIPITPPLSPAGSCLRGFHTPALILADDLPRPASENLHHSSPSADGRCSSEADVPWVGAPGHLGRFQAPSAAASPPAASSRPSLSRR